MVTPRFARLMGGFVLTAAFAAAARGDIILPSFFVLDPTKNSQEWSQGVAQEGGTINSDVNFRTMSPGLLDGNYYNSSAHPDGVTLYASDGSIDQVVAGPGPGQSGQRGPLSSGEGTSQATAYLLSSSPGPAGGQSLTIKFSQPAMAVGLFTIDYFGPDVSTNTLTLSIYDPAGKLIDSATSVHDNFQSNNLYFMGYVASGDVIGSAVFSRGSDMDGDDIGIGPILFATGGNFGSVPEPSSLALIALGAAGVAFCASRRRRLAAA